MSTPSERLEAEIWLDGTCKDLTDEQRESFFTHVDAYYRQNPTADRGTDVLRVLEEDDRAFARILAAVCSQGPVRSSPLRDDNATTRGS